MKIIIAAILSFILNSAVSGATFEYKYELYPGDSYTKNEILHMSGEIYKGDYDNLKKFIAKDLERFKNANTVSLNSRGGNVNEAILISELFKKLLVNVVAFKPNVCLSSCFFIYIGANSRYATENSVGIHRPYLPTEISLSITPEVANKLNQQIYSYVKSWLISQNTPQNLIDMMLSRSSIETYWLTESDVARLGQMSPSYEEWLLARCPDFSNSQKFFLANSKNPLAEEQFTRAVECEGNSKKIARNNEIYKIFKK